MKQYPVGFPLVLYKIIKGDQIFYELDDINATHINARGDTFKSVSCDSLVVETGHNKTHRLLKSFNKNWITWNHKIYFPTPKEENHA